MPFCQKWDAPPTFLPILRTFGPEGKTQEPFVDLTEHLSGVLLSIVYHNWMMISSVWKEKLLRRTVACGL